MKYTLQLHRNYDFFKEAIEALVCSKHLSDDECDKEYLYLKAKLYNIDLNRFGNNIVALEQEIERIEQREKLIESRRAV